MKLSKPVEAHGAKITELTFREPTGGDIRKCGMPYKMEFTPQGSQLMITDTEAVSRYISELGGIPPSSVNAMNPADYQGAAAIISNFFATVTPETPLTDTTNSAGSSGT